MLESNNNTQGVRSKHIGADFKLRQYTIAGSKINDATRILSTPGVDEKTGLTALDLFSIPNTSKKQVKPDGIEPNAWVKDYLYKQFPRSEEMTEEQYLLKLKSSAEHAMYFLRHILDIPRILVPAPTSADIDRRDWLDYIKSAKSINDLEDIYKALQAVNIRRGKKDKISQQALVKHVALCAFIKTTVVMFMLNDGRIELRERAFEFLNNSLLNGGNNIEPLFITYRDSNDAHSCQEYIVRDLNIKASYCARLKSIYSSAMKLILDRKANLKQALKDAVGIRIEVDHQDISIFIAHIVKYFKAQEKKYGIMGSENGKVFRLDIKGDLISQEDKERLRKQFPYLDISLDNQNKKSASRYRDVKLRFVMNYHSAPVNIEIQILHKGHKNENGFSNHILYDLKKKILVMQRLFGVIPRRWLEFAIDQVSTETKLASKNIWDLFSSSKIIRKIGGRFVAEQFYK